MNSKTRERETDRTTMFAIRLWLAAKRRGCSNQKCCFFIANPWGENVPAKEPLWNIKPTQSLLLSWTSTDSVAKNSPHEKYFFRNRKLVLPFNFYNVNQLTKMQNSTVAV